jgi:hypothetical protein
MATTDTFHAPPLPTVWGKMTPVVKWSALTVVVVCVLIAALLMVNSALPSFIERQLNEHVQGYRFMVAEAALSPTLGLEIRQLTMTQIEHPDPPVAVIPRWRLSVQWSRIFSGVLVSDYLISRPTLHITLPQATSGLQEEEASREQGWREGIYSFYPIKINEFKIEDADVTYVDQDPSKPLRVTHLNLLAGNIRNIRSADDTYPSELALAGNLFGAGRVEMTGRANFLAEPHVGIKVDLALREVPLEPLLPVTARYNVEVRGGVLSAEGKLEYSAEGTTEATLNRLAIERVRLDYVHTSGTTAKEARVGRAALKRAKALGNTPETRIRIVHGEITHSEFGFVDHAATPRYRVFVSNGDLRFDNISNHLSEGSGTVTLTGKFMGTGNTLVSGTFRPETKSPDFSLDTKIEKTQMRAMNDLLRAYGNFDVAAGQFSLYSELTVKNGRVEGYLKPLFKDIKVFDARQDKENNLFHQLYEGLVGGVAKLLENTPREEVATKTDLSGTLEDPRTATWQTVVNLVKNAFFKAVLPGLEKSIGPHSSSGPGALMPTAAATSLAGFPCRRQDGEQCRPDCGRCSPHNRV